MSTDSLDLQNQFLERLIKENYDLLEALKTARTLILNSTIDRPAELKEIDDVIAMVERSKD